VILYLHLLDFSQSANMFVLLVFAVLVFVPLRYVYPSRTETLRGLTTILAFAWSSLLLWLTWRLPDKPTTWIMVSLMFPVYYGVLSLWLDQRSRRVNA
jgi:phosphatidylcholine synthase